MTTRGVWRLLDNPIARRSTFSPQSMTLQSGLRLAQKFISSIRGRIALMLATAILLPLAFAPYGQFYLAWVGLAPWLILVATARSQRAAFGWGWCTGAVYFLLSFVYLLHNTIPG